MDIEEVTLRDVLDLGGDKDDLKLIKDLKKKKKTKKNEAVLFNGQDFNKFFKKLGFDNIPEEEKSYSIHKELHKIKKKETNTDESQKDAANEPETKDISSLVMDLARKTDDQSMPKRCLLQTTEKSGVWHEMFSNDKIGSGLPVKSREVKWLQDFAVKLFENEMRLHKNKSVKSNSDSKTSKNDAWMQTMIVSGTLSDRVAALSLMLKETPIHNFNCMETLVAMTKKKGKREAFIGLEAITDLALTDLLPDNRRLRKFHCQNLETVVQSLSVKDGEGEWSHENCKRRLILWCFEHKLKDTISTFVERLQELAYDCLEVSKTKAMSVSLQLLKSKPEQEKALLTLLVDKLGDPKYKIASKALHMLNRLIGEHPLMQGVVVDEVRDLLLRPKLAPRAQYYCICFLSTQLLSHERQEVAQKLVKIYMNYFKAYAKKKMSSDNKMLSALLTGVARAFPYADLAHQEVAEEIDMLFKTVHITNLNTAVRSLVLLFQMFNARNEVSDRFYNALYGCLLHNEMSKCSHRHPMFLNLLYRATRADPCEPRVHAFVKRLLQLCSQQLPPFVAASLTLVTELTRARPALAFRFFASSSGDVESSEGDEQPDSKITMTSQWNHDDDEEEHFTDVKDDDDEERADDVTATEAKVASSWVHQHGKSMRAGGADGGYNPLHRNPQYAGAESTSLWEVHSLRRHYHPTVALFASDLTRKRGGGEEADEGKPSGDPLVDFTLIKFLDRFVYRNPKTSKTASTRDKSVHQRGRNKRKFGQVAAPPVNSHEFLMKSDPSPDELFFHKYFSSVGVRGAGKKSRDKEDVESVDDEEFERFVTSAEGQKQIDSVLNYSDHVYKNKNTREDDISDLSDSDDDLEQEQGDYGDDENFETEPGFDFEEEGGEDEFEASGGSFVPVDDDDDDGAADDVTKEPRTKKRKKANQSGKMRKHVDQFSDMISSNANDGVDTITSSAVRNHDRSTVKQLSWEKKMEEKEITARKRKWRKQHPVNNKNSNKSKKRKFSKRR